VESTTAVPLSVKRPLPRRPRRVVSASGWLKPSAAPKDAWMVLRLDATRAPLPRLAAAKTAVASREALGIEPRSPAVKIEQQGPQVASLAGALAQLAAGPQSLEVLPSRRPVASKGPAVSLKAGAK
jgi:hypothetical protein